MRRFYAPGLILAGAVGIHSQVPAKAAPEADMPAAVPVARATEAKRGMQDLSLNGSLAGRTYTNKVFGFEVTFPDTWVIPGNNVESEMRKTGFDLGLNVPPGLGAVDTIRLKRDLQRVTVVLTAYRSPTGSGGNAIVRVGLEDLRTNPQIRDAVDYFDAMRAQFRSMKLPPDFKYSETGAELLGKQQFGFLDSSGSGWKKRLYATVRKGYAIIFSISYSKPEDLESFRRLLSEANFALK